MALVILPCDLPHWYSLQKHLTIMSSVTTAKQLIQGMLKIHTMCNSSTGLDPDEPEKTDPDMFLELENFILDLPVTEQEGFFQKTLPSMTRRALDLKQHKPPGGYHFSLQQQPDTMVYKRDFLASLLAHSFFSTFPKRTAKTHPTLQDFNFTYFFKHLDQDCQRTKLKSILHYFDAIEDQQDGEDCITFSRQVMSGKQWLTIEDWLDCTQPLCPVSMRHDGRLHNADTGCVRVCFSSPRLGGSVLNDGSSQECIEFCTMPELICVLASVEALEDNETLLVKDVYQVTSITDPRHAAQLNRLKTPLKVSLVCMDAENYTRLPLSQLEEDNLLRELNKALLGFRQGKPIVKVGKPSVAKMAIQRRLSPIGESFSSTPSEQRDEDSRPHSPKLDSPARRAAWLHLPPPTTQEAKVEGRRGRFIVLGSSGECLPVSRQTFLAGKREILLSQDTALPTVLAPQGRRLSNKDSLYSSAQSDDEDDNDDVFHSARTSVDFDREDFHKVSDSLKTDEGYSKQDTLDINDERRYSFAERLRDALLRGATTYSSSSEDSSYAVGISVTGSSTGEQDNVRCKRGTSTGFLLQSDSLDDGYQDSLDRLDTEQQQQHKSDGYSFTTDSSDIEEMVEHLSSWMHKGEMAHVGDVEGSRETAISEFASALLKRAFSDSYAMGEDMDRTKVMLTARSFSLELAKQNPKLAAQLVSLLSDKDGTLQLLLPNKEGIRPVASGNWGCGSSGGDPQLKLVLQWLAASHAGLSSLMYYTCRHHRLLKLDTVRRVLIDRGWTVGELATALLQHAQNSLQEAPAVQQSSLFDHLIHS